MRVYHYDKVCWALENIKNRRLKLSRIDDMNDSYEWNCVRADDQLQQQALDNNKEWVVETFGVLCFSRSWNNILMWSHYGDRHSGICLGFDVPDNLTRQIKYIGNIWTRRGSKHISKIEQKRIIDDLSYAKFGGWSYEEEVRVHGTRDQVGEDGKRFMPFSKNLKLKEVIAGAKFSESKTLIEQALKGHSGKVKILKAARSIERFEIIVDEHGFDR
jgi:hypothetical protein